MIAHFYFLLVLLFLTFYIIISYCILSSRNLKFIGKYNINQNVPHMSNLKEIKYGIFSLLRNQNQS